MADAVMGMPGSIGVTALPNTHSKRPGKGGGTGRYKKGGSRRAKKYSVKRGR